MISVGIQMYSQHGAIQAAPVMFTKPVIKIGSIPSNDYRLDDRSVSRMHAAIEINPVGEVFLTDLGSTAGTFVNGAKIVKVPLLSGDLIKFGDVPVKVIIKEERSSQDIPPLSPEQQSLLLAMVRQDALRRAECSGMDGDRHGDGGAGVLRGEAECYEAGMARTIPPSWQRFAPALWEAEMKKDPEWETFQRLQEKFTMAKETPTTAAPGWLSRPDYERDTK